MGLFSKIGDAIGGLVGGNGGGGRPGKPQSGRNIGSPKQQARTAERKTAVGGGLTGVASGFSGLAGRQGKLGRMTRRAVRRQEAGRGTGALQAKIGRTIQRRQDAGRNVFASGAKQQARGERFMGRSMTRPTTGR